MHALNSDASIKKSIAYEICYTTAVVYARSPVTVMSAYYYVMLFLTTVKSLKSTDGVVSR